MEVQFYSKNGGDEWNFLETKHTILDTDICRNIEGPKTVQKSCTRQAHVFSSSSW